MIVESYHDRPLRSDPASQAKLYAFMVYPISDTIIEHVMQALLPGKSVVMFSGSWRLDLEATYIEIKQFQHCNLDFHVNTIFVDHLNHGVFDYVLHKLRPKNLLILHNDWWIAHQPVRQLIARLDAYTQYTKEQSGQVICTLPLIHLNFNKLTTGLDTVRSQTNALVIDDSIVWIRR